MADATSAALAEPPTVRIRRGADSPRRLAAISYAEGGAKRHYYPDRRGVYEVPPDVATRLLGAGPQGQAPEFEPVVDK